VDVEFLEAASCRLAGKFEPRREKRQAPNRRNAPANGGLAGGSGVVSGNAFDGILFKLMMMSVAYAKLLSERNKYRQNEKQIR